MSGTSQQLSPRAAGQQQGGGGAATNSRTPASGRQQSSGGAADIIGTSRKMGQRSSSIRFDPADMPSEAKLWRGLALCVSFSLVVAGAIGGGLAPALGLTFHLQSLPGYAMMLAVFLLLCMSIYCVYCSS
jgi:hypothetical protein